MTWVKLDDQFAGHPKTEAAGPLAAWLHVAALCHCATYLTDGLIIASKAPRIAEVPKANQQIRRLIDEGMWHEPDHTCPTCDPCPPGHYLIHDYLKYQKSRAEVEADRHAAAERQRRAREKAALGKAVKDEPERQELLTKSRRDSHSDTDDRHAVTHAASHGPPDPTRPDPSSSLGFIDSSLSSTDGDQTQRDPRVTNALTIIANADTDSIPNVRHRPAVLAKCLATATQRDGADLERLAQLYPDVEPYTLVTILREERAA